MGKALKFDPTALELVPSGKKLKAIRSTSEEREAVEIPIDLIDPYTDSEGRGQPFQMYGEEEMAQMVQSVREMGILTPVLLRPIGGRYQTIAGHNRIEAARQAGLQAIPAVIREYDDNDAAIAVVDTNLRQRQHLLPSERARAYKVMADAIGRKQGQRNDLKTGQKQDRAQLIADQSKESKRTVFRYLALNDLTPSLLQKVDVKVLSVETAGALTALNEQEQRHLEQVLTAENVKKVSASQAEELAAHSRRGELDEHQMRVTLGCIKEPKEKTLTIKISVGSMDEAQYKQMKKAVKDFQTEEDFAQRLLEWLREELVK